jgi:hypothetical protein
VHGVAALAAMKRSDSDDKALAVATRIVDELARQIRRSGLGDLRADRLAAAIAWLPWTVAGGRSGLLAALASKDVDVTGSEWWSGFGWPALRDVGDGTLGAVLRRDDVKRAVTSRTVAEGLASVTNREALSAWLGAPRIVHELVDPEAAGARIAVVIESDHLLAEAFSRVRRESLVSELRGSLESLESELQVARRKAHDADTENVRVSQDRDRLRALLDAAAETERTVRASERRQAKIDAVRAIAQIVATAKADAATLTPDQLERRLISIAQRAGVRRRGEVEASIEFDPAWCEAPGQPLPAGAPCIVVRPAYEYVSEQEDPVLLLKAVVRVE